MDLLTLGLILAAAVLHASWHGVVKGGGHQIVTLAGMGLISAAAAVAAVPFVSLPPGPVWLVIGAAATLHSAYKLCLASAYKSGDLVQAFPLARGTVPVFAMAVAFATLGQRPTKGEAFGVFLISAGVLSLTYDMFKTTFKPRLLLAALGAGMAVATYTVLDAYGTRLYGDWLSFTAWVIVVDALTFVAISRVVQGEAVWTDLIRMQKSILVSGFLGLGSFSVFLWALSRNPVGPVSALRETSILFAMLIGAVIYREPLTPRRLAGGLLIISGVLIIATSH
jgi:drug/metabolite transporter (DMT)-like permease